MCHSEQSEESEYISISKQILRHAQDDTLEME